MNRKIIISSLEHYIMCTQWVNDTLLHRDDPSGNVLADHNAARAQLSRMTSDVCECGHLGVCHEAGGKVDCVIISRDYGICPIKKITSECHHG